MKKNAILIVLGLLAVLFFVCSAARFYRLEFVERLSFIIYDYTLRQTLQRAADDRIVIVDIDEKSLNEEGRWPWGHDRMALLMDKLFDKYGVAVVGFDIVFAEPDQSSGLTVLQKLGQKELKNDALFQTVLSQIQPQLEYDKLFAAKIKNRNVVLGYYFSNQKVRHESGMLPSPTFIADSFQGHTIDFTRWNSYGANLPELQQAAASAGHFNPLVDFDGKIRRVPMLVEYGGSYYESLSLAIVRTLLGANKLLPVYADTQTGGFTGLEWLELEAGGNRLKIPVDNEVASFVPYRGKPGSYRYISITDVLHDRVAFEQLKDKIILIGATAPGLLDMRVTPVDKIYPGVEIHANLISGILDQSLKAQPVYMLGAEVVWLLVTGISLSFLLPLFPPGKVFITSVFALMMTAGLSRLTWQYGHMFIPIANSLVMIIFLFTGNIFFIYFKALRTTRQMTETFGFIPREGENIAGHSTTALNECESRIMTTLFLNLQGFSKLAEEMNPPELLRLMKEFLSPLSRTIIKNHGAIDKNMGDCMMAFWDAPLLGYDHAHHALLAGMEILALEQTLRPFFRAQGWPNIQLSIGIHTGLVSVGNMGSEKRPAYTVMGEAAGLASRLRGVTQLYGVNIIVSEDTRRLAKDFLYRELDHLRVKGKDKPLAIYEPIVLLSKASKSLRDEVKIFHEMRRLYQQQNWDQAELQLMHLQRMSPETVLYKVYAERVTRFRKNPPGTDCDGEFVVPGQVIKRIT